MENEYGLQGEVKLLTGGNAKLSTRKQCEARDPCANKADLVQVQSQRLQSGWKKTMNRIGHLAALVCHVKALERNVPGFFFIQDASPFVAYPLKMVFATTNMKGGAVP